MLEATLCVYKRTGIHAVCNSHGIVTVYVGDRLCCRYTYSMLSLGVQLELPVFL